MGEFTVYDDQWVDEQIQAQLDVIVQNITAAVCDREISIVLSGGFGRGEGSVIITENQVVPLKDYDIWVFSDKKIDQITCDIIRDKVSDELGFSNARQEDFQWSQFVVDIAPATLSSVNLYPDIFSYELKEASKLLYGKDIRNQITVTAEDVSVASGLRLLFQKMVGLIGHFRDEYLTGRVDRAETLPLIYECYKTYVEIATALCILMGCYEPSFASRARLFRERFREGVPYLYAEVPELGDLVTKSTSFKLRPDVTYVEVDPVLLWDQTRTVLGKVLRFYMNSCLNMTIDDWTDLPQQAYRKMGYLYYRPMANAYTYTKFGTKNDALSTLLVILYQKRLGYEYAHRLKDAVNTFYWRALLQSCSPILLIYLTGPLVLCSLLTTGEMQKSYFDAATKNLRRLIPMVQIDQGSNWNDLRSAYLFTYNLTPGR